MYRLIVADLVAVTQWGSGAIFENVELYQYLSSRCKQDICGYLRNKICTMHMFSEQNMWMLKRKIQYSSTLHMILYFFASAFTYFVSKTCASYISCCVNIHRYLVYIKRRNIRQVMQFSISKNLLIVKTQTAFSQRNLYHLSQLKLQRTSHVCISYYSADFIVTI